MHPEDIVEPVQDEAVLAGVPNASPATDVIAEPVQSSPPARVITHAIINLGEAMRAVHQFVPNDSPLDRTEASVSVREDGTVHVEVLAEA